MKNLIMVAAGLLFSFAVSAQKMKEKELPSAVKESFKKNYPNAKEVKWEKEGSNFEAEFEIGETESSVVYDANGILVESEVEIKIEELPAAVKDYVSKNYKAMKIKEAAKITAAAGAITYEVEIKGKDLIFDSKGNFIKEEAGTSKDKD